MSALSLVCVLICVVIDLECFSCNICALPFAFVLSLGATVSYTLGKHFLVCFFIEEKGQILILKDLYCFLLHGM